MCGNHDAGVDFRTPEAGSPPRVREPRYDIRGRRSPSRITPACAGTTHVAVVGQLLTKDHPRVCGNHITITYQVLSMPGSPPRVREPLDLNKKTCIRPGITPACAGTTA